MVRKSQQSLTNNQTNKQCNVSYIGCTRVDIVLLIHNRSPYLDFKNQLGFLVTTVLDNDFKLFKP